jgi:competence protein ComEC
MSAQPPSTHIDAFARYRQSRPGPRRGFFGPNLLILLLAIAAGYVWWLAAPRLMVNRSFELGGRARDTMPDGLLTIVILDVGQGDGNFIRTPGGYNIVYDVGEGANPENTHSRQYPSAKFVYQPFLDIHGIYDIDLLVLSHPDSDHGGGMADFIHWIYKRGGSIGAFLDAGVQKPARFYQDILAAVEQHNIKYIPVLDPVTGQPAEYPEFGGNLLGKDILGDPTIAFQILGPIKRIGSAKGDKSNDNSVIIRIQCGEISYLVAGDAEDHQQDMTVPYWGNALKATISPAPHHGSKTSDQPNWLRMVNQRYITTSSHPPVFGHPAADAMASWKRYINPTPILLRTDMNGDIWFRTDGKKLEVRTQFPIESEEKQWEPGRSGEWRDYRRFEPNEPTIWSDCIPVPGSDSL